MSQNPAEIRIFLEALNGDMDGLEMLRALTMTGAMRQIFGRFDSADVGIPQMPPVAHRHANEAYCPDLFKIPNGRKIITQVMQSGSYDFSSLRQQHPSVSLTTYEELDRFRDTLTFFKAISAPKDLDDVFGEPYCEKDNLYVLAAPKRPEELIFYSSEELVQSFLSYSDFNDPKEPKKLFTDQQIARLRYLANRKDDVLAETMEQIRIHRTRAVKEARKLFEDHSVELECCLKEVLDAAMYMRGWKGEGPYPLTSMDAFGDYDKVKSSQQLLKLRSTLDACTPLAQLPLMLYSHGRWKEGYQLGGPPHLLTRLTEVMNGRDCIRETSNFFAATAWFYLNEFYKKAPFELEQLREIL